MATTFGTRPEDAVADSRGNVLSGVVLTFYATKSDALNQTAPVTTVTTNTKGLYPYADTAGRSGLWARDPAGNVWAISSEEVGASVDAKADKTGTPKSFADFGVLPSNTADQNRAGFLLAQASGYTDFVLPAGTYQWAMATNGTYMMTFTNQNRIRIRGINAVLNDTSSYSNNGPLEGLFLLDGCKGFDITGVEYVGPLLGSPSTLLGYQGATLVRAINGTDDVKVDMRAANCRYGVQTGDYADATKGQCKNFDVKIRGTKIGYALAAYYADGIRFDVDVDGIHRAAYIAGCNDVKGVARWRDQYIASVAVLITDCLTSGTDAVAQVAPPANPTTSRGCNNIDVVSIDKGSTVFQNTSVCAGINLSRIDPCRFENIKVRVYTVGTDTVSTRVGGFNLTSVGVPAIWSRYTYNWEPTVILDNIEVSGVVDHSAQTLASNTTGELYVYTKDDAGEAGGHYATVRQLDFKNLTVLPSAAASPRPLFVIAREPAQPIRLSSVNAPGLELALVTSTTMTTVLENCNLAKLTTNGGSVSSLVTIGNGCNIAVLSSSTPQRVQGTLGVGGAGGVLMQKETTLTLSGASVTWSAAIPGGSLLLGVQGRNQTAITGATGTQVGVTGDLTRFKNSDGAGLGATFGPSSQSVATNPLWYLTNTDIVVTARTSNFTGGTLRLILTYMAFTAPTA